MPKKNAKAQKSNELDGAEFFAAINLIEKEKGIPKAYMLEKITQALVSAYKRDHEGAGDNVTVEADEEAGTVRMFVKKDVVEEVDNPCTEMSLQMAREKLPHAQLGDVIRIEVRTRDFGRIAAQTARQVIIQGMREAERGMIYDEFSSKEHEILTGVVTRVDPRSGAVSLRIGSGSEATEAFLAPGEQVKGEAYLEGMRLRVYVVEVRRSTKGPQVLISRTHPGLVKRLFELEVPEIYDGTVEVKSIAREAGSRTKLAVWSADPDVDPIGACVGPRGQRVNNIVEELKGEKVDIIKWSEEPAEYIAAALSPADVTGVVTRVDPRSGAVSLRIGSGSEATEAFLAPGEQVKGEAYLEGMRLRVYVVEVRRSTKGPQVLISRTHPGLVKRLFELEVPEIYDGTVEVKSIAREAGSRTKLAVWSADPDVDPIGACVGPRGQRVNNIVEELKGEKVDIIKWSEEPAEYIAAALSPADVVSVAVREEGKACRVVVPDDQLSLAIGKEGQNARLAAKLTGWKIDIKPASAPADEEPEDEEDVLLDDEAETEE